MPGPMLRHIHLASRDHDASLAFYAAYFDFRFDVPFARGTIIRSPQDFQIFLEPASDAPLPPWFHFGFLVESEAAGRALLARMQADGVPITVLPHDGDPFFFFFFHDPDGHLVQVYYDPHAA